MATVSKSYIVRAAGSPTRVAKVRKVCPARRPRRRPAPQLRSRTAGTRGCLGASEEGHPPVRGRARGAACDVKPTCLQCPDSADAVVFADVGEGAAAARNPALKGIGPGWLVTACG